MTRVFPSKEDSRQVSWNRLGRRKIEKRQRCGNMRYVPTKANGVRIGGQDLREKRAGRRAGWSPAVNPEKGIQSLY